MDGKELLERLQEINAATTSASQPMGESTAYNETLKAISEFFIENVKPDGEEIVNTMFSIIIRYNSYLTDMISSHTN